MLRLITAGESHGPCLTLILEGLPSGIPVDTGLLQKDLKRRQHGYGRGDRMKIEQDQAQILSGVRHGKTLGSPITLRIDNRDWINWQQEMNPEPIAGFESQRAVHQPRPGHADLAGMLKFRHYDMRNILERASARETAARVAAGALLKQFLGLFYIKLISHTVRIGEIEIAEAYRILPSYNRLVKRDSSPLRCLDPIAEQKMIHHIDSIKQEGDTLGGIFEVIAYHVPVGLGSHTQWDRKLDGRLAQAFMSIPGIKAVEIGAGISNTTLRGSEVHDPICFREKPKGFYRRTNRAGGLEGGISNGMPIRVRGFMKPISTLAKPLRSVDIRTKRKHIAVYERSDVCVVPAAGIVGEAMMALVLADALMEKFGGDSVEETQCNFKQYIRWTEEV